MSKNRNLSRVASAQPGHMHADSATFADTVTASAFIGSGAQLTGITSYDSAKVQGQIDSDLAGFTSYDSAKVQGQFDSALPVALASDVSLGNITTTGYLRGPATFEIDPSAHGDETGTLRVRGNLTVEGTTTTINSTTVETTDLAFTLAKDAADSAACQGAGFIVKDAATASFTYSHDSSAWVSSKNLNVEGTHVRVGRNDEQSGLLEIYGGATGAFEGAQINLHPTADHAGYYAIDVYDDDMRFLNYTDSTGYYRFYGPGNTGTIDFVKNAQDMTIEIGSGNYQTIIGNWAALNAIDIDSLLPGSTFGTLIQSAPNGHCTLALRGNDVNDGFNIISGGGDYQTDKIYDTVVAHFRADGKVGIGHTAPATNATSAKLDVFEGSIVSRRNGSQYVELKNVDATGSLLNFHSAVGNAKNVYYNCTTDTSNTAKTSGSLSHQFQIRGTTEMLLQEDGDLHVDGDVIAYSTTVSDIRLKDNVETLENSLDKVCQLRGVSYEWNAGHRKGQKEVGLIAQEVEQVFPEIVREKAFPLMEGAPDSDYKTVDYEKLVGVLIEAVKELKAEIEELKGNQ